MESLQDALNRLGKWRVLFTGWQLGTRPKGDPEGDAVRDHREATIMLRAEVSAMTVALAKCVPDFGEAFHAALMKECELLNGDYERRFPGVTATQDGLVFDSRAVETMKGWRP